MDVTDACMQAHTPITSCDSCGLFCMVEYLKALGGSNNEEGFFKVGALDCNALRNDML